MRGIRAIAILKHLFVTLSVFASVGYCSAAYCFADCAAYKAAAEGSCTPVELSAPLVDTVRPDSPDLNIVEQTNESSLHCDNCGLAFIELPIVPKSIALPELVLFTSTYTFYTEFDNKFIETVKILQTLK